MDLFHLVPGFQMGVQRLIPQVSVHHLLHVLLGAHLAGVFLIPGDAAVGDHPAQVVPLEQGPPALIQKHGRALPAVVGMHPDVRAVKGVPVLVMGAEGSRARDFVHVVPELIVDMDDDGRAVAHDAVFVDGDELAVGKGLELHFVLPLAVDEFRRIIVVDGPAAFDDLGNVRLAPPAGGYFQAFFFHGRRPFGLKRNERRKAPPGRARSSPAVKIALYMPGMN